MILYDYLMNYVNIYYEILVVNKVTIFFIIVQKFIDSAFVILDISGLIISQLYTLFYELATKSNAQ